MSRAVNKVILLGNIGADPEVRATASGTRVATLSLATSKQWKDARGEKQERTAWHRIICWNTPNGQQLADIAEKYCRKGAKLYVEGEIEYRSWDGKDGEKKYTTEIVCRELVLLGGEDAEQAKRGFDQKPEALEDESDDLPF